MEKKKTNNQTGSKRTKKKKKKAYKIKLNNRNRSYHKLN